MNAWIARAAVHDLVVEADRMFPLETGGILFGYWANDSVVITDVIGPGPRARHRRFGFRPDTLYHEFELRRLYEHSGRRSTYLGDWHSHPGGTTELSRMDVATLQSIARAPEARAQNALMAVIAGRLEWRLAIWRLNEAGAKRRADVAALPVQVFD